jgi:hypothetical protein
MRSRLVWRSRGRLRISWLVDHVPAARRVYFGAPAMISRRRSFLRSAGARSSPCKTPYPSAFSQAKPLPGITRPYGQARTDLAPTVSSLERRSAGTPADWVVSTSARNRSGRSIVAPPGRLLAPAYERLEPRRHVSDRAGRKRQRMPRSGNTTSACEPRRIAEVST